MQHTHTKTVDVYHRCFKLMNSPKWNPNRQKLNAVFDHRKRFAYREKHTRALTIWTTTEAAAATETAVTKPQSLTLSPSVFCDSNQVFYLYSSVCILLLFNAIYVLPLICSILVRAHMPRFWEVWISNRFIHYIHNSRKQSIQLKRAAGISTCVTPIWWSSFFVVRMMRGWVKEQQRRRRWQ